MPSATARKLTSSSLASQASRVGACQRSRSPTSSALRWRTCSLPPLLKRNPPRGHRRLQLRHHHRSVQRRDRLRTVPLVWKLQDRRDALLLASSAVYLRLDYDFQRLGVSFCGVAFLVVGGVF
ncbi:unnamed protein product [Prorocentrum cordatum]|uniref:Uncharacterized protein n=1 Tax=Prorocentrum cordatum TaxID=2364126 RepID=A0ABN9S5U1_9DINO|nr:unnamed protein product [Polarella glacialis]